MTDIPANKRIRAEEAVRDHRRSFLDWLYTLTALISYRERKKEFSNTLDRSADSYWYPIPSYGMTDVLKEIVVRS